MNRSNPSHFAGPEQLALSRLSGHDRAGLWISSLPLPRGASTDWSLDGRPTWAQPIGQWFDTDSRAPRRLLLASDAGGEAPDRLRVQPGATRSNHLSDALPPTAEAELFARCDEPGFMWERHLLRLRHGERSVGLAMGLRHDGEVHWWECCRLIVLAESPRCRVIEMGGAIPHKLNGIAELMEQRGYDHRFLHRHNWLYGRLFARLHANGVCEVFAHHINSRFVDDGLELDDVAPVIGIACPSPAAAAERWSGLWDGRQPRLDLPGVSFDLTESARLATPEQPGRIDREGSLLAWQPYMGAELFGGIAAQQRTGDPFICRAVDRRFPRGMARTLRFSLSLSDRPPEVARYLAPAWWFGHCEELLPDALLPVSSDYDATITDARQWVREHIVRGGFEDGAVPRQAGPAVSHGSVIRRESGWEGEIPHAQFISAWLSGDADEYHDALRSAYHFTDVVIDHAAKAVRMHSYPPHAFSMPMNRVQGTIAAYLETGDPYLIETARAVLDASHAANRNAWPRLAVGRDACYGRSAAMLYRYFGSEHARQMAREVAMMVVESQRPDGAFGDQAGGTGVHQWGAYITKPWMGLLALGCVLDYLELVPDEPAMLAAVRRFADWLMTSRVEHAGVRTWPYQHDFAGADRHFDFSANDWVPLPSRKLWHHETLARLLGYCALRFDEPAYLDAWAESHSQTPAPDGDHQAAAAMQFLPWLQTKLWRVRLTADGVQTSPFHFGSRTPTSARVLTPAGPRSPAQVQDLTPDQLRAANTWAPL